MFKFLGKVAAEIRIVSWTNFNELVIKTFIVIVVFGILMLFCYAVDLGITAGIRRFSR